ncbi:hypothetical protein QR680_018841 [Steinernema hermaphroditum]|uniref:Histone-lysine N-methyltransferase n=1 Tax=Steinernema hermaphroditum TaxID=289476 RepID=A0AA39LQY8_9BILA|nr:hypothetical protein QR680_018841 [Steinernema hermaphroditum]
MSSNALIAVTTKDGRPKFAKRDRANICFCCRSEQNRENLTKCGHKKCDVGFHEDCFTAYTVGGFNAAKMVDRVTKARFCSRHYCTYCYGNGLRTRAFYGRKFISCSQCELAWHPKCIPAGCDLDENGEIICPRHRAFDRLALHINHCASCQEPDKNGLLQCQSCVRSVHFTCAELNPNVTEEQFKAENSTFTCPWCRDFVFVTENLYCMGYSTNTGLPFSYYPCVPVSNSEYPGKKDTRLGNPGYVPVKWMMWRKRVTYGLLPHAKIVEMNEKDYFFITAIDSKRCDGSLKEPWREAQNKLADPMFKMALRDDQKPLKGQEPMNQVRMVNYYVRWDEEKQKLVKATIPAPKKIKKEEKYCDCSTEKEQRCGPQSGCYNRAMGKECPKDCGGKQSLCLNRVIQNGEKCGLDIIEVFDSKACGKGVRARQIIEAGTFIGEYHGEIITESEAHRRIEQTYIDGNHEEKFYIMHVRGCYVDAKEVGGVIRYVNHSCSPNCEIKPVEVDGTIRLALFADKDISIGEELTFHYGMESIAKDVRTLPDCYCGADACSGVLGYTKSQKKPAPKESPVLDENNTKPKAKKKVNRTVATSRIKLNSLDNNSLPTRTVRKRKRRETSIVDAENIAPQSSRAPEKLKKVPKTGEEGLRKETAQ